MKQWECPNGHDRVDLKWAHPDFQELKLAPFCITCNTEAVEINRFGRGIAEDADPERLKYLQQKVDQHEKFESWIRNHPAYHGVVNPYLLTMMEAAWNAAQESQDGN